MFAKCISREVEGLYIFKSRKLEVVVVWCWWLSVLLVVMCWWLSVLLVVMCWWLSWWWLSANHKSHLFISYDIKGHLNLLRIVIKINIYFSTGGHLV